MSSSSKFTSRRTRTVAILSRSCAKVHRLAVQARIQEAGFEVLLQRMEEWAYPDDVDFLYEFFRTGKTPIPSREDAEEDEEEKEARKWIERLTGGPICFMVLERVRAVETWKDLIGEPSSAIKGKGSYHTSHGQARLGDIYGHASLYGSSSERQAERQIAICASDLATEEAISDLEASISMDHGSFAVQDDQSQTDADGSILIHSDSSLIPNGDTDRSFTSEDSEEASDNGLGSSIRVILSPAAEPTEPSKSAANFRSAVQRTPPSVRLAREMDRPSSLGSPSIQPRLTRAAALRMGVEMPVASIRAIEPIAQGDVGISGLPKASVILPKSLAKPSIQPRANKASMVRIGGVSSLREQAAAIADRPRKEVDYSQTPGHKRANTVGTFNLASLAAPSIQPRLNAAARARIEGKGSGPIQTRSSGFIRPLTPGSANSRELERVSSPGLSVSGHSARSSSPFKSDTNASPKRRPLSVSSLAPPKIAPRANRAAVIRGGMIDETIEPIERGFQHIKFESSSTSSSMSSLRLPTVLSDSSKRSSPIPRERKPVDFTGTPGHKRRGSFHVPALNPPKIEPRSNAAAQKRLSVGGVSSSMSSPSLEASKHSSRPASSLAGPRSGGGIGSAMDVQQVKGRDGQQRLEIVPRRPISVQGNRPHQDGEFDGTSSNKTSKADKRRSLRAPPSAFRGP